ncbi:MULTISPECIES: SMP-30/gluconolactonase/LRE family protein [Pseudonocardia]|uniref:Virginiamycin B lyase n=2 Tax=Pseudonocardia TaxID=1847 RepID=A0A1Y2N3U1_PSEAH|nr:MULTISPECIES: SMP-30/gluconolactonase/LRE family protein [Pseudonocardia]OSY42120.1 Virginiamycin B lyase [Pseudonocardia autotrophica]TDN75112.1 sugar lactone lactonase YvrE [Pseudonocardia autotrophica]BBF99057.1 gluconolactonase [Pseudonocardia autotrophica]GEC23977.1 gluconolaconase [Pseudonocardia saturnea]
MTTTRSITRLATGGHYFEAPRWHDGRWWVSDIYAGVLCTYDEEGTRTEVLRVEGNPSGIGWLPDGSMLVVSMHDRRLLRRSPDGEVTVHADLSRVCEHEINDLVVTSDGRAFTGTIGFAVAAGDPPRPGAVFRVDPDGSVHVAAEDVICPNGMVVTGDGSTLLVAESFAGRLTAFTIGADGELTDRRLFAQLAEPPELGPLPEVMAALALIPDGCAIDAEDGLWVADAGHQRVLRFDRTGTLVEEIADPHGNGVYACALGGDDGRSLLICTVPDFFAAATGVDTDKANLELTRVDVPHGTGRP